MNRLLHWILLTGFLFGGPWMRLSGQTILSQTVAVDATGTVIAPSNFWTANIPTLVGGLSGPGGFVPQAQWTELTNSLTTALNRHSTAPFGLSFTGLVVTVSPGSIDWPDGSKLTFDGGSLTLFPNFTNYLVLNYGTGRLHSLYRYLGGGGEHLLAVVVTGPTGPQGTPQINTDFTGLPTRIPGARGRLLSGCTHWEAVLLGDATTGGGGSGVLWKDLLFSPLLVPLGLTVTNVGAVTVRNFGLAGANAEYGLALVSRSAQSFGSNGQGSGGHGAALDLAGPPAGPGSHSFTSPSGDSSVFRPTPDLVTIGFGIPGSGDTSGAYTLPDLEAISRACLARGSSVIYLTENDPAGHPLGLAPLATAVSSLSQTIGGAVADTAAYVDERNRQGINTYVDPMLSNQAGWNAWAEAILGVLNPWPQAPLTTTPHPTRVLEPTTTAETSYLGWGATWVAGTPVARSVGVTLGTDAGGPGLNDLPHAFGTTSVWSVPGSPGSRNFVDYYHSCWTSASLTFERGVGTHGAGTNSFSGYCAWIDQNGAEQRIRDIRFTDDNDPGGTGPVQRPGMLDLASVSQVLPAIANLSSAGLMTGPAPGAWNHGALRIVITNGNARILGVLFRGPRHHKLTLGRGGPEGTLTPSWFDDTGDPVGGYPHLLSSDTPGDILGIRFRGQGLQLTFRRSTAGGQVNLYGNGTLMQSQDLYAPGRPPWIFQWSFPSPAPMGDDCAEGESDLVLNYIGDNPSKTGPSYGFHAVTVSDALVIY